MRNDEKQPFMSHLAELRSRLIACAISTGAGFIIAYIFSEKLFEILMIPLKANMPEGDRLIYPNSPEMFFTYLNPSILSIEGICNLIHLLTDFDLLPVKTVLC